MSHEIRTPLGAIMGFAELLKKPELSPATRASFVAVIERNSQHLLRIVDDILDLSKVEAGKIMLENIEFSLPELLSDFASLMGLRARDKGIHFAMYTPAPIPALVFADPTRLRQILNNIVGNAIKFTERGSVELRVLYANEHLELEVQDTGRGISEEQAARLFQAFMQADESTTRKFGGTGLGLVLTKRLASAMGGDFYLKVSRLFRGSTFVARIQVGISRGTPFVEHQMIGFSPDEPADAAPGRVLAGMRILVVDDSPDNRTLLGALLEDAGASVEMAHDGRQGIERALAAPFDAVLMDIQMPRMDGYQAMDALTASGYAAPVIALTAHAMVQERERAHGRGFAAFLTKPIKRGTLLHRLDGLRREPRLAPATAPVVSPAPVQARSVLIVEDNADSSEVMELYLSSLGFAVRCAGSGQEALSALGEGFVPELVLLDLTLPDMSGQAVMTAVRRAPAGSAARILIVSGWDNLEQRKHELGADGFLRKPINLIELGELAGSAPR